MLILLNTRHIKKYGFFHQKLAVQQASQLQKWHDSSCHRARVTEEAWRRRNPGNARLHLLCQSIPIPGRKHIVQTEVVLRKLTADTVTAFALSWKHPCLLQGSVSMYGPAGPLLVPGLRSLLRAVRDLATTPLLGRRVNLQSSHTWKDSRQEKAY